MTRNRFFAALAALALAPFRLFAKNAPPMPQLSPVETYKPLPFFFIQTNSVSFHYRRRGDEAAVIHRGVWGDRNDGAKFHHDFEIPATSTESEFERASAAAWQRLYEHLER
jgi:hypothetical protein